MSAVYSELKTVLKERAKPESQFEIFRQVHADTIREFKHAYGVEEEEILTTLYIARFIISGDVSSSTAWRGVQQRLNDHDRAEAILKNIIESKKHIPDLTLKERIFLYSLTWQITWEVEKAVQKNLLTNEFPLEVLFCRVTDHLIVPLLQEWDALITQKKSPNINFRWILAEIMAALENDFPVSLLPTIEKLITEPEITSGEFFLAGWTICTEFWNFLKVHDFVPVSIPDATHRHLTDNATFAGLFLYRLSTQEFVFEPKRDVISSRMRIVLTDDEQRVFKNLITINHPAIASARLLLSNSKYTVTLETNDGKNAQRFFYLFNTKDVHSDLGIWAFFLIQGEDVNFKLMEDIFAQRFTQFSSILALADENTKEKVVKKKFPVEFLDVVQTWEKTLIVELQDDSRYTGHLEDQQKSQTYMFLGVSETSFERHGNTLIFDSIQDDTRVFQQTDSSHLSRINNAFYVADLSYSASHGIVQLFLDKHGHRPKKLVIHPSDAFFYNEKNPQEQLLFNTVLAGEGRDTPYSLVTGIGTSRALRDILHRGRQMDSIRNLQRLVRTVAEARGTKPFANLVRERLGKTFSNNVKDVRLEAKWDSYFSLTFLGGKSGQTELQAKVLAHEQAARAQFSSLVDNVTYYLIKEFILPFRLLSSERGSLETLKSLENVKDYQLNVSALDRKIQALRERMGKISNVKIREYLQKCFEDERSAKLELYIDEYRKKFQGFLQAHNESELKDILISF